MTSYGDIKSIADDLKRWRDEGAEAFEARASLMARYHRAENDEVAESLLRLDSDFFEVWEAEDLHVRTVGVAWRDPD